MTHQRAHQNSDFAEDRRDDLPDDLRELDDSLARVSKHDRAAAPDDLEARILDATAPLIAGADRRTASPVIGSIGARAAIAAAAAVAIVGGGVWLALRPGGAPSPTGEAPIAEAGAETTLPIEEELDLLLGEDDSWAALDSGPLVELDESLAGLDEDRESFWPDLNDPLLEDSL